MLPEVLEYIKKHCMIKPGEGVVAAVSGGADSLALIHILKELRKVLPMELYIAHIDHGLRGKAAKEDALFVRDIAKDWGIDFFLKEARVRDLSKKWGISEEEAGRKVRYDFFEEVRIKTQSQRIALAHHRDDQVETVVHNIIRGTGLLGLGGIEPLRDGIIIRPLLEISRKKIESYCEENHLVFREDQTNLDVIYTRNRIRHMLLPMIEEHFNPNFRTGIVRMADILRDEEDFLRDYTIKAFEEIGSFYGGKVEISLEGLNKCHRAIKGRILRRSMELILGNLKGIEQIHINALLSLAKEGKTGSILDLPKGLRAIKDYDSLHMYREDSISRGSKSIGDFEYPFVIPGQLRIPQLNISIEANEVDKLDVLTGSHRCIYIDADSIRTGLRVRNRRPGDRISPLGMKGSKKLKDFFIDRKIPARKRGHVPLILDGDNILWIVGHQMGHEYRVTQNTKRIIELKVFYNKFHKDHIKTERED